MSETLAIIGGGIVGISTALYAAQQGWKVTVYDMNGVANPHHASGDESRLFRVGYYENPAYVPLLQKARNEWIALGNDLYQETGLVYVGQLESELIDGTLKSLIQHSLDYELISPAEGADRFPQFKFDDNYWCLFEPQAGFVRAGAATAHLAKLAIEWGVEFRCESIHPESLFTDYVLVAAGYQTAKLIPELAPFIKRVRYQTVWFGTDNSVDWKNAPCFGLMNAADEMIYGFPDSVGLPGVKVGAHIVAGQDSLSSTVEQLARMHLNGFSDSIIAVRECSYDQSPDGHFIIGHVQDNVYCAAGFSGHGFKFGSVIGSVVFQSMTEGHSPETAFLDVSRYFIRSYGE